MQEKDNVGTFECSPPLSIGGLNQIFICSEEGCSSRFLKRSYLEQHMCIHTNERPFVCSNDGCIKSYKRKDHLNRHMRSCPSSERIKPQHSSCAAEDCEHECTNGDQLHKPNRDPHATKKTFTCSFEGCSKTFKKHKDLKSHKFEHTQKNPFQCPHPGCEMSFRWMNRLKRHAKIHEGYSCSECEQKFEKWTLLLKHKSSAHKVVHTCSMCGKTFSQQHRLNIHMKVHSQDRLVYECPREDCVRYYSEKRNLDAHIRSYHDSRRFPCTHEGCTRTFAFKHKMLEHLKSHSLTRKVKKKLPKKSHPKKSVISMLTGLKFKTESDTKESSDNDDLLSTETKSFSVALSCDGGEIDKIDNSPTILKIKNMDFVEFNNHLADFISAPIIDIGLPNDKHVPNTNCQEVPDSPTLKIGEDTSDAKSQTNLLEVTMESSDDSLLTNTDKTFKPEPTNSPQNDHSTSMSSSSIDLQVSQSPKLSFTSTSLKNDEIKILDDHSVKSVADDQLINVTDDSTNELEILAPNVNLFKCTSHSFLSDSLLKYPHNRHTIELRSFPCPRKNCHNVYTAQQKLNLHLKCDHDGLGFQCKYANCGMVFGSKHLLRRHFNTHFSKIRPKKKKKISDIISKNVI